MPSAVAPPSECPMHQATAPAPAPTEEKLAAAAGPVHQDRAYEFVECPMKAAAAGQSQTDIDPTNMVSMMIMHVHVNCSLLPVEL